MTDPVETIVVDPARVYEVPPVLPMEASSNRLGAVEAEFLDETWAIEFDRRLAAWEAEIPVPTLVQEAIH